MKKNLDLSIHHCDKSTLYYVEFIEQIGNDTNSYLRLNSKDASLFIYKKTLFDINNEYRKQFNLENIDKQIMCFVELVSNIINIFIEDILKKNLKNVSYLERDNIV